MLHTIFANISSSFFQDRQTFSCPSTFYTAHCLALCIQHSYINSGENFFLIWLYVHFCWCENRMGLVIYTQYVTLIKKNIPALFLSCLFSSLLISFLFVPLAQELKGLGWKGQASRILRMALLIPKNGKLTCIILI